MESNPQACWLYVPQCKQERCPKCRLYYLFWSRFSKCGWVKLSTSNLAQCPRVSGLLIQLYNICPQLSSLFCWAKKLCRRWSIVWFFINMSLSRRKASSRVYWFRIYLFLKASLSSCSIHTPCVLRSLVNVTFICGYHMYSLQNQRPLNSRGFHSWIWTFFFEQVWPFAIW
jgi:hypothetical protein